MRPSVDMVAALQSDGERAHDMTVLHRLRHGGDRTLAGSAEWILDQLVEYADVRAGHVFWWRGDELGCAASYGDLPEPERFESWLRARLSDRGDMTELQPDAVATQDLDRAVIAGHRYRLVRLITSPQTGCILVGALVLLDELPVTVPASVQYAMADRLQDTFAASPSAIRYG